MEGGPKPEPCKGLTLTKEGAFWTDSAGKTHDLSKQKRLWPEDVARELRISTEAVLRLIRSNELYPVIRLNPRSIQIFECVAWDYLRRHIDDGKAKGDHVAA